ncbi:MAG: hypothetical protein JWO94_1476 [Verrucomicrobiaceae bacterium]|nr:hypothetical protein [Verrucomicrobiaceae bacterium]
MIPIVTLSQMETVVHACLPSAEVEAALINPDYGSWRLGVKSEMGELEFSWGPLSGFGVWDYRLVDENIFAPYDHGFASLEEARAFLENYSGR